VCGHWGVQAHTQIFKTPFTHKTRAPYNCNISTIIPGPGQAYIFSYTPTTQQTNPRNRRCFAIKFLDSGNRLAFALLLLNCVWRGVAPRILIWPVKNLPLSSFGNARFQPLFFLNYFLLNILSTTEIHVILLGSCSLSNVSSLETGKTSPLFVSSLRRAGVSVGVREKRICTRFLITFALSFLFWVSGHC
jgi:hypothetical protein